MKTLIIALIAAAVFSHAEGVIAYTDFDFALFPSGYNPEAYVQTYMREHGIGEDAM